MHTSNVFLYIYIERERKRRGEEREFEGVARYFIFLFSNFFFFVRSGIKNGKSHTQFV